MKNSCIIFLLSVILCIMALGGSGVFENEAPMYAFTDYSERYADEFLRMHIRADSNLQEAQKVKYAVRDRVVEYLTPLVATYRTREEAIEGIRAHLPEISDLTTDALRENGFTYKGVASLTREYFPTRIYEDTTLPAGEYTALILTLGEGEGDNWWCVVYPPLCFAGTDVDVCYRSRISEIIEEWRKR